MTIYHSEGAAGSDPLGKKDPLEVTNVAVSPQDAPADHVTLTFTLSRAVDAYDAAADRRGDTPLGLHEGAEVIRRPNSDPGTVIADFDKIEAALMTVHRDSEELRATARRAVDRAEQAADQINRSL